LIVEGIFYSVDYGSSDNTRGCMSTVDMHA